MAKLKFLGSGECSIQGIGDFVEGVKREVSVEVARTFIDENGVTEAGWEVSDLDATPSITSQNEEVAADGKQQI